MTAPRFFNLIKTLVVVAVALVGCNSRTAESTVNRTATNEYHGCKVADPYQWLENATNPAVREWTAEQNKLARSYLEHLPIRPLPEDRLTRLLTEPSPNYFSLN